MSEAFTRCARTGWALAALLTLCATPSGALEPRRVAAPLDAHEFFLPELYLSSSNAPLSEVLDRLPNRAAWEEFARERAAAGQDDLQVFIDPRSGAATNVLGAFPLIPGDGLGNTVTPASLGERLGRSVAAVDAQTVAEASHRFVTERQALLGIDARQLGPVRATQVNADLWQVSIPQVAGGVRVRDGRVVVSISHGNVVTFGTEIWGNVTLRTRPTLSAAQALDAGFEYAGGRSLSDVLVEQPKLEIVPVAPQEHQVGEGFAGPLGQGYRHRLVWTFAFQRPPEGARWEPMVDAHTGEVIAFQDTNHYVTKQFTGGVYPVTDTGICPNNQTCGTMQTGWPMPFANTGLAAPNNFTNSAGNYNYPGGTVTTTLAGQFVRMSDNCGALSATTSVGDINLGGTNNQHDCTTGTGGGAGNTPASRSGFYELNKLAEQARGWLPANTWLQAQLTANMNIALTCNAFWNGSTVNFYRSGGGCRNTGEIAAVFDHEWGHGLDDNDAAGALSNSSEAYADIAAIYRLQASCVGFGFFDTSTTGSCGTTVDGTGKNQNESQTGTHCDTNCSGVRDSDWALHADNTPDTALGFVCTHCSSSTGPCGRQVHCAAAPARQAAWDLVTRDLTAPPFNYDSQTAFLVGNKVFYQGSGNIGTWHACTCGASSDGCAASNGYMQWLTADDDNGNLNDGTPHMSAIYAAFNRHGIACATPTPVNSGCASGPTGAASLSTAAGDSSATLSWSAVPGASTYWVLRSEGHAGCDFGKAKIAEVTGTSYIDTQVANGRLYSYNVVAQGASAACYGPVSNCSQVTPVGSTLPDFSVAASPASLTIVQGGSDASTITVSSQFGFSAAVNLACAGLPAGVSCAFAPASVTPPGNGSANSTLSVSVAAGAAIGSYSFDVVGTSGSLTHNTIISLVITAIGAQSAVYDATLQAPKCGSVGSSCDSGPALLLGRYLLGPEPNQPNTLASSCADGTLGTFHSDESNDALKVSTLDGSDFAAGKTVKLEATVWAWSTGTSDALDLYYAADANSPSWTFITTIVPPVGGAQVLSANYTLPAGTLQAVRARFRYTGTAAPCGTGSYDDHDDLAFAVGGAPPAPDFSVSVAPASLSIAQGGSGTSTTTVTSLNGFNSAVALSCSGQPAGVTCSFAPASVTPPAGGSAASTLTVSVGASVAAGSYAFNVVGTSGSLTHTAALSLTVTVGGPVTVVFTSIAAEDGYVQESSETSNVGGSASATGTGTSGLRVGDLTQDRQLKSVVSFDTSSLPDGATVTAATLTLVRGGLSGTNPFTTHGTCQLDIVTGAFGGANALAASDFEAAATATAVGSMSNPASNGASSTGSLNASGLAAINKTGRTQLRVYFTLDDNDDGGTDYVGFYAGDNGTASNRPTLTVTYQ